MLADQEANDLLWAMLDQSYSRVKHRVTQELMNRGDLFEQVMKKAAENDASIFYLVYTLTAAFKLNKDKTLKYMQNSSILTNLLETQDIAAKRLAFVCILACEGFSEDAMTKEQQQKFSDELNILFNENTHAQIDAFDAYFILQNLPRIPQKEKIKNIAGIPGIEFNFIKNEKPDFNNHSIKESPLNDFEKINSPDIDAFNLIRIFSADPSLIDKMSKEGEKIFLIKVFEYIKTFSQDAECLNLGLTSKIRPSLAKILKESGADLFNNPPNFFEDEFNAYLFIHLSTTFDINPENKKALLKKAVAYILNNKHECKKLSEAIRPALGKLNLDNILSSDNIDSSTAYSLMMILENNHNLVKSQDDLRKLFKLSYSYIKNLSNDRDLTISLINRITVTSQRILSNDKNKDLISSLGEIDDLDDFTAYYLTGILPKDNLSTISKKDKSTLLKKVLAYIKDNPQLLKSPNFKKLINSTTPQIIPIVLNPSNEIDNEVLDEKFCQSIDELDAYLLLIMIEDGAARKHHEVLSNKAFDYINKISKTNPEVLKNLIDRIPYGNLRNFFSKKLEQENNNRIEGSAAYFYVLLNNNSLDSEKEMLLMNALDYIKRCPNSVEQLINSITLPLGRALKLLGDKKDLLEKISACFSDDDNYRRFIKENRFFPILPEEYKASKPKEDIITTRKRATGILLPNLLWRATKFIANKLLGGLVGKLILPAQDQKKYQNIPSLDILDEKDLLTATKFTVVTHDEARLDSLEIEHKNASKHSRGQYVINFVGNDGYYEKIFEEMKKDACKLECNVIGFNFRGVGQSTGKPKSKKDLITDGIAQVQRLLDKGIDPENIILKGHSLGGAIATLVAKHFHKHGKKINLFNARSFSTIPSVLIGLIHTNFSLAINSPFAVKILNFTTPFFIFLESASKFALALTKWGVNPGSAYKDLPDSHIEYMLVKSPKNRKNGQNTEDDIVISNYASLHAVLKNERKEQRAEIDKLIDSFRSCMNSCNKIKTNEIPLEKVRETITKFSELLGNTKTYALVRGDLKAAYKILQDILDSSLSNSEPDRTNMLNSLERVKEKLENARSHLKERKMTNNNNCSKAHSAHASDLKDCYTHKGADDFFISFAKRVRNSHGKQNQKTPQANAQQPNPMPNNNPQTEDNTNISL
jgi:alpha/beta hydrolase fold